MSRSLSDLSMPLLLAKALPALWRPRLRGGLTSSLAGGQGPCAFAADFDFVIVGVKGANRKQGLLFLDLVDEPSPRLFNRKTR